MATQNDTRAGTFLVETDIPQAYLRVGLSSNGVSPAGASGASIGTATRSAMAGMLVAVEYHSKEGSKIYIASEPINVGEYVVPAAAGKVSGSVGAPATVTDMLGIAVSAAGKDGDQVEVAMGQQS